MKVLVVNCGSSTLKFQLLEADAESPALSQGIRLAYGTVDRIGEPGAIEFSIEGGESLEENARVDNHGEATERALKWLDTCGILGNDGLDAVGHRIVHGGDHFIHPTLIDDMVLGGIELVSHFAPLHNQPSLNAIRAARATLGLSVPMVAVFDTAFHHTMPSKAAEYAIPQELSDKHRIRRYGFHGIAHQYMTERYAAITNKAVSEVNLITLQLGNGCSAAAVRNGQSVDTSMGLTPLEGLIMGTRSGDVDPSLAGFLARKEEVSVEEVENWLNRKSGLMGISGHSRDMRELLEAERRGNNRAALAVEMFCYRIRKYIGAYMAALGKVDAVVFGGGIGENAPVIRERICADMDWCGLKLDSERNSDAVGRESVISSYDAGIAAYVIPVDEAVIIARDTVRCLQGRSEQ